MHSIAVFPTRRGAPPVQYQSYNNLTTVFTIALAATAPFWAFQLFNFETGPQALALVPAFLILDFFLIIGVSNNDAWLRKCMTIGLFLKLASAAMYLWFSASVWSFSVDAFLYVNEGSRWAEQVQTIGQMPGLTPFWGTNFITSLTGAMIFGVGRSWATLIVAYAMIAFWGQFLIYRAFCLAVPKANRRLAAIIMFLTPSIAFWTAMVGKDAILCFSVGLIAYGLAQLTSKLNLLGIATISAGFALTSCVRPHVAALAAVAATAAVLIGQDIRGIVGATTRLIAIPLILAVTLYVGVHASAEWQVSDFRQGVTKQDVAERNTNVGGSGFSQPGSRAARLAMAPFVFFRPFPWEARSPQTALSAIESLIITVMTWRSRHRLLDAVRRARKNPFVVFMLVFTLEFGVAFAPAISNFGLLVRQRVMALPFFLLMFCIVSIAETRRDTVPM